MSRLLVLCVLPACVGGSDDSSNPKFESLADIVDLSVNQASATVDAGGLYLDTDDGDNAAGGFNGTGTGNKSIAGFPGWDGLWLGALSGLAVETTSTEGGSTPYFNLVLDLDGAGCNYKVIVADTTLATASAVGDGMRYSYAAGSAQWKAVGGLDDILPGHLESTGGALSDVLAAYPGAVLADADTGDNGLPAGVETTSLMLILGDSLNHSALGHTVSAVEVSGDRYVP